jgi:hypothetical protein
MHDRLAGDDSNGSRWALFGVVALIHGALLLLALHSVVRLGGRREDSLVFLVLPKQLAAAPVVSPRGVTRQKKPAVAPDTQLLTIPAPAPPALSEQPPAPIDWKAEAELAANRQAELAESPPPRALDQHGKGIDLNGGLGPDHKRNRISDFAWDRKHTNRVEVVPGAVVVQLSDHCVLVFFPFPFAFCGIGKIQVRGDLLDHMHDEPQGDGKNIAP